MTPRKAQQIVDDALTYMAELVQRIDSLDLDALVDEVQKANAKYVEAQKVLKRASTTIEESVEISR